MRVLITGGAGFIGSHIVAACLEAGYQVRVLDARLPLAHPVRRELPPGIEDVHGDIRDEATVAEALRDVDVVCHQAAMVGRGNHIADAPAYTSCNDFGSAVLLSTMTRIGPPRLVLAGSVVIYGDGRGRCAVHGEVSPLRRRPEDIQAGQFEPRCPHCAQPLAFMPVDEDAPPLPRNLYGLTKLAQENLARVWADETGAQAVALRYHQVYGPGMTRHSSYSGVTCTFRSVAADRGTIQVFEDGAMRRDFIHVRDIALANVAAIEAVAGTGPGAGVLKEHGFRAYNVATGTPSTVFELAAAIAEASGAPRPELTGQCRFDDVRHIVASPARLVDELRWRPTVGLHAGVAEFVRAPLHG